MADLLSFDAALSFLINKIHPLAAEDVSISQALGRALASPVHAPRSQPPQALSAMDGYAVQQADLAAGLSRFTVIGESAAGSPFAETVHPGETVRIFTGATLPDGADRIIIQEDVTREGDAISVTGQLSEEHFVRSAGMDFEADKLLLKAEGKLSAIQIGLATAANCAQLSVYRQPKVALFATGDELVEPGLKLQPHHIINSAAYGLEALIQEWGGQAHRQPILPDDQETVGKQLLSAGNGMDLIITIGGASVGDYDVIKPAVKALGADIFFEKVAVRPGKPTWFGKLPDGPFILGLPGNPASALVCAHLFLKPLLDRFQGGNGLHTWIHAKAAKLIPANGPRESFLRGQAWMKAGEVLLTTDDRQDSSLLTPFAAANVLIRRQIHDTEVPIGQLVEALPIGPIHQKG